MSANSSSFGDMLMLLPAMGTMTGLAGAIIRLPSSIPSGETFWMATDNTFHHSPARRQTGSQLGYSRNLY